MSLTSLTVLHSDPHMDNTFKMLHNHFITNKPHKFIKGRSTKYEVENLMDKGVDLMTADGVVNLGEDESEGDDLELLNWGYDKDRDLSMGARTSSGHERTNARWL
jgi:hypothetical protein